MVKLTIRFYKGDHILIVNYFIFLIRIFFAALLQHQIDSVFHLGIKKLVLSVGSYCN